MPKLNLLIVGNDGELTNEFLTSCEMRDEQKTHYPVRRRR